MKSTILSFLASACLAVTAFAQVPIQRSPYTTNIAGATINAQSGSLTNLNTLRASSGYITTLFINGTNANPLVNWLLYDPADFGPALGFDPQVGSATLSNLVDTITVDAGGLMTIPYRLDMDSGGIIEASGGAIGAPSITFEGATDAGIWFDEVDDGLVVQGDSVGSKVVIVNGPLRVDGSAVVTGALTADTIGTTINPDIDAAFDAKLSVDTHDTLAADYLRLSVTNALGSFIRLQLFGNVDGPAYTITDPSWTMDWDSITNKVRIVVTNDFTISEINLPASGFKIGTMIECVSPAESADDWLIDVPWEPNANREHPVLQPGKRLFLFPWYWIDGALYSFEGDQSLPLADTDGGTGTTLGQAVSPEATVYVQVPQTGTNWNVDFGSGVQMEDATGSGQVNADADIMFPASSGRPSVGGRRKTQDVFVFNTHASDPINVKLRDEWKTIGITNSVVELESSNTLWLSFVALSSTEDKVWAINRTGASTASGGGGEPPAENSLTNGLVAYYNFEQTGTSTLTNAVPGGSTLNLVEAGGAWTKGVTGVIGNGWTNISTSRVLSNDASGLRFGRSGESYSASYWYNSATTTTRYMIGEWGDSPEFGWYGRLSSGSARWNHSVSANGTSVSAFVAPSSPAATAGLHHIVDVFDNDNDIIRKYVDGVEIGSAAFTGDVNDSSAPFTLGGLVVAGVYSSIQAMWDEVALYNRAVTSSEVELLYNGGSGTNLNLILNP